MTLDVTCMRCNTIDESIMHVIHDCEDVLNIETALSTMIWGVFFFSSSLYDWLKWNLTFDDIGPSNIRGSTYYFLWCPGFESQILYILCLIPTN